MTVPSAGQDDPPKNIEFEKCPSSSSSNTLTSTTASSSGDDCLSVGGGDGGSQEELAVAVSAKTVNSVGLSSAVTKALFPYSVVIDDDFSILQVGQNVSKALNISEEEIFQSQINDVLEITKPMNVEWNWEWMRKLEDQSFQLEPILGDGNHSSILFKASIVLISNNPTQAMLIMSPDAQNLDELTDMNLTLSDLPVHGDYRDAIFLREHLSTQMNNALKMEKLSKSLQREKQLLESLLPEHAAEGLRAGRTVEPRMHQNVSFFFSDIVGFTNICKDIYPWDVIGMLNRLYCVMDFLAIRFRLFKVETIGGTLQGFSFHCFFLRYDKLIKVYSHLPNPLYFVRCLCLLQRFAPFGRKSRRKCCQLCHCCVALLQASLVARLQGAHSAAYRYAYGSRSQWCRRNHQPSLLRIRRHCQHYRPPRIYGCTGQDPLFQSYRPGDTTAQ
jgi:class 3 adenylate cyclase